MIHETALKTFNEVIQTANIMSTVLYIHQSQKLPYVSVLRRIACLAEHVFFLMITSSRPWKQKLKKKSSTLQSLQGFVDKSCTYRFKHLCPEKVLGYQWKKQTCTQQNEVCPSWVKTLSPLLCGSLWNMKTREQLIFLTFKEGHTTLEDSRSGVYKQKYIIPVN